MCDSNSGEIKSARGKNVMEGREDTEYYVYTPDKGFLESIGWNGISHSQIIEGEFSFLSCEVEVDVLASLPSGSLVIDGESLSDLERLTEGTVESKDVIVRKATVKCDNALFVWNRVARDLDGLSDRDLLEELCCRVVDYHATSLKFHDCERGTVDELMENDNNYCRVREVVQQVLGIDLEYVEEVKN